MSTFHTAVKELQFQVARKYSLWRIGVLPQESRSYNTTDKILLTFDDYGDERTIQGVLAILKQYDVKAAFFLQGDWAEKNKQLVQQVQQAGHWLANHSYSHQRLSKLDDEAVRTEITKGLKTPLLRPPYGAYDKRVRAIAHELGFKISFWTIDSDDWKGIDAVTIHERVLPRLHKGACVLLHLNTPYTLEALPGLIEGIRARGYELCSDGSEIVVS